MGARQQMPGANERAQQSVAIKISRETLDPAAPEDRAAFPIGARDGVEVGLDPTVVGGDVLVAIRLAKEAMEALVIRQVPRRAQLEPVERDMRAIEVDRGHVGRIGGQIAHDIAAAGGDGDDVVVGPNGQRLHVDDRVLPNLRINQALERESEQALEHPVARKSRVAMHGGAQSGLGRAIDRAEIGAYRQIVLPLRRGSDGPLQPPARPSRYGARMSFA